MSVVYISGPMTGLPEYNYPAFDAAEHFLEGLGYIVKSPHKVPEQASWKEYMIFDIKLLLECDTIVLLPGWEESKGATLEARIASALDLDVLYLRNNLLEKE